MKLTIAVAELSRVLKQALGVVQGKVTIPVLSFIKIDVNGINAQASASDLGMSIIQQFAITLSSDSTGSLLLPAKKTQEILAGLTARETLTIEQDGNHLILKAGKYRGKLPTVPADQFPPVEARPETKLKINLGTLKMLIRRVECAVPAKEGKFVKPILHFEGDAAHFRAVATDGARIAIADAPSVGELLINLPLYALPAIKELTGTDVEFTESETNYFFTTAKENVLVRKSPAEFPKYQKVLSVAFATKLNVSSKELKTSIDLMLPVLDEQKPAVVFDANASELTLNASSIEGESADTLGVLLTGVPNRARLNPKFVLDFLSQADGQPVDIEFLNERGPVRFSKDATYQYFLMPIQEEAKDEKAAA